MKITNLLPLLVLALLAFGCGASISFGKVCAGLSDDQCAKLGQSPVCQDIEGEAKIACMADERFIRTEARHKQEEKPSEGDGTDQPTSASSTRPAMGPPSLFPPTPAALPGFFGSLPPNARVVAAFPAMNGACAQRGTASDDIVVRNEGSGFWLKVTVTGGAVVCDPDGWITMPTRELNGQSGIATLIPGGDFPVSGRLIYTGLMNGTGGMNYRVIVQGYLWNDARKIAVATPCSREYTGPDHGWGKNFTMKTVQRGNLLGSHCNL